MMWNVSCVVWKVNRNGRNDILVTHARSFRSEKLARSHYRELVSSYRDDSYFTVTELDGNVEGIRGWRCYDNEGRNSTRNVVIFISPNPDVY